MKWPLTWEKKVFHQPVLPEKFLNFTKKTGNINKFYHEGHYDFLCQIFVKRIEIIGKNFEIVCRNSEKFYQFYLKRNLNWIWEMFITSQCSLKKPEGSLSVSFL